MCMGRDGTSKEGWYFQCNSGHAIDESGGGRWIHAILQCPLTHNKTASTQSELTNHGIDKLHTLSRGIVGKEDIPSRFLPRASCRWYCFRCRCPPLCFAIPRGIAFMGLGSKACFAI